MLRSIKQLGRTGRIPRSTFASRRPLLAPHFISAPRGYSTFRISDFKAHLKKEIDYTREPNDDKAYLQEFLQERKWTLKNGDKQVIVSGVVGGDEFEMVISAQIGNQNQTATEEHSEGEEHQHEEHVDEEEPVEMLPGMETQEDYFTLRFTKKSNPLWALQFKCCAHSGVIEIDTISINDATKKREFTIQFSELEQETQDFFYQYLADKSINNELSKFIFIALNDFDQEDYCLWAEQVKAFVSQ